MKTKNTFIMQKQHIPEYVGNVANRRNTKNRISSICEKVFSENNIYGH